MVSTYVFLLDGERKALERGILNLDYRGVEAVVILPMTQVEVSSSLPSEFPIQRQA